MKRYITLIITVIICLPSMAQKGKMYGTCGKDVEWSFDNVTLTRSVPVRVNTLTPDHTSPAAFDLMGRRSYPPFKSGLYISGRRKLMINK